MMYRSIISIKDKRFNVYQISEYHLLISIGNNTLRIVCIDQTLNRCLLLEVYQIDASNTTEYFNVIKQLFQAHRFLATSAWKKVVICFENQQYTLVPLPLFQEKNSSDYLKLAVDIGTQSVKYCLHTNLNLGVVFGVDTEIVSWLQKGYHEDHCHIIHQANSIIAGTAKYLSVKKIDQESKVFVLAEVDHLHITVMKKSQLMYYNRFVYNSSDEFLQYILIVMYALALNPAVDEVIIAGNVTKNSLIYRKIRNYIKYVSFSNTPAYIKFGWTFKKNLIVSNFDLLNCYPATDYLNTLQFS